MRRRKSKKLVASTRLSGSGEIAKSNRKFRAVVKDSGDLIPKYGKALIGFTALQQLESLFN